MINRTIPLLLGSLVIFGCSSPNTQPVSATPDDEEVLLSMELETNKNAPARVLLKGQIIIDHEVRSIQVCGSDTTYWLDLPKTILAQADSLNRAPNQPLYGEVWGYLEPATSGFATEYGAKFVVTDFNIITAENPKRCEQPERTAKAFGNEPSWSANIDTDEITLVRPGADPQTFAITNIEPSLSQTRYLLETGQLTINKQICRDSMSDSIFSWSAQLEVNGEQYSGCRTDENFTDNELIGRYTQALDPQTNIQLTLDKDHQSETRYLYADDSADVVESGFWQALNNGLIQVVSTSYQGQRLIAVREFDRQGKRLSTDHETINGATYPLTSGGLDLQKTK